MSDLYAIGEGEESIRGKDGPMKIELELSCFFNGLAQAVDTAGLPASLANELLALHQGNGVRFQVLTDYIGEFEVFFFRCVRITAPCFLPLRNIAFVMLLQ